MGLKKIGAILIICLFPTVAFTWDDSTTHKDLSEIAANKSVIGTTEYLKNIGLNEGLLQQLKLNTREQELYKWIREGAQLEDAGSTSQGIAGTARYVNHFHNPLKPWTAAGLDDTVVGFHYTGESFLLWAQDSARQSGWLGGDWTWQATRIFFYNALTKNTDAERQSYFAQTFRGLGHQMHLIQDASQPAHVRNDAHPLNRNQVGGLNIEPWAAGNSSFINALAANPIFPSVAFNVSYNGLAPITQLFDTDQYNGAAPSVALTQGIAEYTNANFASQHTIFAEENPTSDIHYFPYPRKSSTDIQNYIAQNKLPETKTAEDGVADVGFWIAKTGDGENYDHFAKPTYLTRPLEGTAVYYKTFYQDTNCHEDYAEKLIPRTVGYSAGLLNYFFRGSIEVTLPSSGIYSSATNTAPGFTTIKVQAKNTTANNEAMLNGSIELVVKYRLALEDPFKAYPVDYYMQVEPDFSYIVAPEKDGVRAIPSDQPVELTFDLTTPIPLWAIEVYLQVVYHGKLGNEDGAVAVGFKDISEPTPVDLYNNMDKICLNGGWYDAGSQAAIDQAPILGWDVYAHDVQDAYLKISPEGDEAFASPSNYTFPAGTIPRGTLYRAYVLSDYDYPFNYSDYTPAVATTTADTADHANAILIGRIVGSAIKNQIDYQVADEATCAEIGETAPCDVWYYPLFYSIRGNDMWGPVGFIADNPKYPTDTNCSWELLLE